MIVVIQYFNQPIGHHDPSQWGMNESAVQGESNPPGGVFVVIGTAYISLNTGNEKQRCHDFDC